MKKGTLSKLKSIFGSKKGKKHHQENQSTKSPCSASPVPAVEASSSYDDFRPLIRTPPPTRAGPPPSPPVPTNPKAPVAPEPSGPQSLKPCLVCGRTFLLPSLAKHMKICEKMTVKKRKTFDSSRQRREGTDLEQYLPKNFGLPENSPFLEKSPPPTAKPAPRPKTQAVRSIMSKHEVTHFKNQQTPTIHRKSRPTAELQKCPHCSRNFGVRAFERHVDWCADKAKILPAAPVQPPQHITEAKQRLNARTKYKAPPVRGRRSSQTRDKSSNSRSASVESSRGISPPREYGDYRNGRTLASESISSNDCLDDNSPHVPVIRNTRQSLNNSSGDAHVKARQARLARDLSSTRPTEVLESSVQQSNNDKNINKTEPTKQRIRVNVKKQQQLKKLEQIASKYDERVKERLVTKVVPKPRVNREKSMIPVLNKNDTSDKIAYCHDSIATKPPKVEELKVQPSKNFKIKHSEKLDYKYISNESSTTEKPRTQKSNNLKNRVPISWRETTLKDRKSEKLEKDKNTYREKESTQNHKKISISLDSLEDIPPDSSRTCQSVGINTELLCVPCIIHETIEPNISSRKAKTKFTVKSDIEQEENEPSVELLYKNTSTVNTSDMQIRYNFEPTDSKEYLCVPNSKLSSMTSTTSTGNFTSENIKSVRYLSENHENVQTEVNGENNKSIGIQFDDEIQPDQGCDSEEICNLSAENNELNLIHELNDSIGAKSDDMVECHELYDSIEAKSDDVSHELNDSIEAKSDDVSHELNDSIGAKSDDMVECHELYDPIEAKSDDVVEEQTSTIECRYGSGGTYTKFTENPDDLQEFITLTDKLMNNSNSKSEENLGIEQTINSLHTPKTISLETINKESFEETKPNKYNFSDTFQDLKNNFRELIECAGDKVILDKTKADDDEANKKVSDMEHITVYELKFYEKNLLEEIPTKANENYNSDQNIAHNEISDLKLPSIEETNRPERKIARTKKRNQHIYKTNKYKLLRDNSRSSEDYKTFIVTTEDNSDGQSITLEPPPLKLPRIETKKRLDESYDPFASAARQMKELMSTDANMSKSNSHSSKDLSRTLPILRPNKEKSLTLNTSTTKMMKDTLNKSYQKTPSLQRMKSFGSTNNDNNSSFGGRSSSFRIRNDKQKSSQKLNTTFTKSSKENISAVDKSYFNRNSNLNRSFSSYNASSYSTPKPKDKIPKIATSMYHSFQRTTIKQPVKLDKIKRDDEKKDFVSLDAILTDDNSSMTDSNYIDPRLINENDNLPINVNTILNNPDIISSMESLLTTENLPAKFESFSSSNLNNNSKNRNGNKLENNNNFNKKTAPVLHNMSTQYDKVISSLEQSLTSKNSVRDDESLCEDFDLEEFMTTFDDEITHKLENKRTCSSTTRVVKQSELTDSNRNSEFNSVCSTPKLNGMNPVNKSMSLTFSSNNVVNENLFPSSVKRSTSLLDSIQKKSMQKVDNVHQRHKVDQLEQDLIQSLKDFDKMYASEKDQHSSKESIKYNGVIRNDHHSSKDSIKYNGITLNDHHSSKESIKYSGITRSDHHSSKESVKYVAVTRNGTARRDSRAKTEGKLKKDDVSNGNFMTNGKASNDSAYSSLNRISPSKLSLCTSKQPNGLQSLEPAPVGSHSGSHKDDARSISSEEFLAMERSAELDEPLPKPDIHPPFKDTESSVINDKRASSRASSRRSPTWRGHGELSSSSSEVSLHRGRRDSGAQRLSRFCHECGTRFSVEAAKFCIECGVKRLTV